MSSVLYFPIINYKYVRKENIEELTHHICTTEEINGMLEQIERHCDYFQDRKYIDLKFSGLTALFPLAFLISLLSMIVCSVVSWQAGVWYSGVGIVLSFVLLLILILSSFRITALDRSYRRDIQNNITNFNKTLEKKGNIHWEIGKNNTLELHQKEDTEFKDYYENDDEEDYEINKVTKKLGELLMNPANFIVDQVANQIQQLDRDMKDASAEPSRSVSRKLTAHD